MIPDLCLMEGRIEDALQDLVHLDPDMLDANDLCDLFAKHDVALVPMEQVEG